MKVLKQFIKEFWIPTLAALVWTYYSAQKNCAIIVFIKNFGAAFFLTSWFGGQILRIIKQQKLEGNLSSLLERLEKVSDKIERIYIDIKGYTTGGESFCYLDITRLENTDIVAVIHNGNYPLYDISMRLTNLNNLEHENFDKRPVIEIGDLGTGLVSKFNDDEFTIEESPDNYIKYRVDFYSRKGHFIQDLRLIKFENIWYSALRVMEGDAVIYTKMDEEFPIKEPFKL